MVKHLPTGEYESRRCRLTPVTGPTRCGGCGAAHVLPKGVQGSELRWMLAGGWQIDVKLMTIRCPACVAQAERRARVLAS